MGIHSHNLFMYDDTLAMDYFVGNASITTDSRLNIRLSYRLVLRHLSSTKDKNSGAVLSNSLNKQGL